MEPKVWGKGRLSSDHKASEGYFVAAESAGHALLRRSVVEVETLTYINLGIFLQSSTSVKLEGFEHLVDLVLSAWERV